MPGIKPGSYQCLRSYDVRIANIGVVMGIAYTDLGWRGEEIITTIAVERKGKTMNDTISRKQAIETAIKAVDEWDGGYSLEREDAIKKAFSEFPTAQPERKKAHWIDTGSGQECSACHEIQCGHDSFRFFCAHCGADMRGEQDG